MPNTTTEQNRRNSWDNISTPELIRAVELIITPEDLTHREAALAILETFAFTPEDVKEITAKGEYFNTGWVFNGLDSSTPQIIHTQAITRKK